MKETIIKKWHFQNSKLNKVVAVANDAVYFGNLPKQVPMDIADFASDEDIVKFVFSIPYTYIRRVESVEKNGVIRIFYGKKSEDYIKLSDPLIQNEIFDFLKMKLTRLKYTIKKPSYYRASKPSIFSFFIVLGIMLYALFVALEIEKGVEFIAKGGFGGIILAIAQLGFLNILLIFVPLLILSVVITVLKIRKRALTRMLF